MEIEHNHTKDTEVPHSKPHIRSNIDTKIQRFFYALILASNSIGISSLAFPSSMAKAGIGLWMMLMVIAILVNYLSSYILVFCGKQLKVKTYADLTQKMLGKFKAIIDVFYVFTNLGIILSCSLTFNDFMSGIFNHEYFENKNRVISSKESLFWIIVPNMLLLPLLLRRSLKDIKVFSIIAVFAVFLLSVFVMYVFMTKRNPLYLNKLEYFNINAGPQAFTLLLFGFMNQQNILDVFSELKRKKIGTLSHILKMQTGILTYVYFSIALFGYLSFYNYADIRRLNIFAFDLEKNALYMFINFCVGLSMFLSSIVTFKPTKDILISYFNTDTESKANKVNFCITVMLQFALVVAACLLVIYDINFLDIINIVSIFVAPLVCIYLPLYYYVRLSKKYAFLLLIVLVMFFNTMAIVEL